MKHNGSYVNRYDLIPLEISDASDHWTSVTSAQSDRLKELELELALVQARQNYLTTTQSIVDNHGAEMLQLMWGRSDAIATCPESEVVFGRFGGRALLIKALEEAQERVIIVCPWLSRKSIDDDMLLKFRAFLDQGDRIDIGWGYSHDVGKIIKISGNGKYFINAKGDEWQSYSALPQLHELQESYPSQFRLKLLGTHAKYWVCDRKFAYVGSHNVLSSNLPSLNTCYPDLVGDEVGTLHRTPRNIQKLIKRFEHQPNLSTDSRW